MMCRKKNISVYALCVFASMPIYAQNSEALKYPVKPIKIIVGYPPGGSNDIIARLIARKMYENLGQTVLVENRPSTSAIIGTVATAKAPPDGYTLMITASGPIVINPATYSRLPYSPQKDFTPISLIGTYPLILSVKNDSKISTLSDLVKWTRDNPKESNYSASSSTFQLAAELLKDKTGIKADHIPYKGSMESMNAVASGDVTMTLLDAGPAAGAIKGKLIRGLAVTSDNRMKAFPDIPTLKEQGVDLKINIWTGLFAPAGTPTYIVKILEKEMATALADPRTQETLVQMGIEPTSNTSEEFARQIATEIPMWTELAKKKNIKSD